MLKLGVKSFSGGLLFQPTILLGIAYIKNKKWRIYLFLFYLQIEFFAQGG